MDDVKSFAVVPENHIGFIGSGNMAFAIASGLINQNLIDGSKIIISATSDRSFERWKHLKVQTTLRNFDVIQKAQIIFLCFKPQNITAFADNLNKELETYVIDTQPLFISILAGTELSLIKQTLSPYCPNILRVMPNTSLQVGQGCTAITKSDHKYFKIVKSVFDSLGICEEVEESKFHAITGLSGSGPAYVYTIIDALSDAGVKQGLPRDLATKFAAQTLLGSAKTLLLTKKHPGVLKDEVCSPGGTTIAGVAELERGGLRISLINAVEAATKRSKELQS